ncbi:hypothetical protein R1flu_007974 [Riccia fluitans]|uniref:Reverse transcriptase domain-containing protein n=1 Tax=Riccia fluitans TaxID=41844 RepID=A0ABD1YAD5_9MARC
MREATRVLSALYASENCTEESRRDITFVNSRLCNKLSDAQRLMLEELPSKKEIQDALFSFPMGKAPGIDGTNAESLQAVWDFTKPVYLKVLERFWSSGVLPHTWLEASLRELLKPLTFGGSVVVDFSLFADDMGVYLELDEHSFLVLRGLLVFFESAAGARLNLHKSSALIIGLHVDPPQWLRHLDCVIMEHKRVYRWPKSQKKWQHHQRWLSDSRTAPPKTPNAPWEVLHGQDLDLGLESYYKGPYVVSGEGPHPRSLNTMGPRLSHDANGQTNKSELESNHGRTQGQRNYDDAATQAGQRMITHLQQTSP